MSESGTRSNSNVKLWIRGFQVRILAVAPKLQYGEMLDAARAFEGCPVIKPIRFNSVVVWKTGMLGGVEVGILLLQPILIRE